MEKMTTYNVGDLVRIAGRCGCGGLPKSAKGSIPALALRESSACWHGVGTRVLRVFPDGDLLLENRHGFVRGARPDEVCR
jgi:hypothetical protein